MFDWLKILWHQHNINIDLMVLENINPDFPIDPDQEIKIRNDIEEREKRINSIHEGYGA